MRQVLHNLHFTDEENKAKEKKLNNLSDIIHLHHADHPQGRSISSGAVKAPVLNTKSKRTKCLFKNIKTFGRNHHFLG